MPAHDGIQDALRAAANAARARRRCEQRYRAAILKAAAVGASQTAIAAAVGSSRQNVQQILNRPTTLEARARPPDPAA